MAVVIHIDGANGVGKTTLRRSIVSALRTLGMTARFVDDGVVQRSARGSRSYTHARAWFVRAVARSEPDVIVVERGIASHIVFDHASGNLSQRSFSRCQICRMYDQSKQFVLLGSRQMLSSRLGQRTDFKAAMPVYKQHSAFARAASIAGLETWSILTKRQCGITGRRIAASLLPLTQKFQTNVADD